MLSVFYSYVFEIHVFLKKSIFGGSFGPPDLSDEYRSEILRPGTSRRPQNSLSGPILLGFVTLTLFSPRTRIVNIRRNNIVQACRMIGAHGHGCQCYILMTRMVAQIYKNTKGSKDSGDFRKTSKSLFY